MRLPCQTQRFPQNLRGGLAQVFLMNLAAGLKYIIPGRFRGRHGLILEYANVAPLLWPSPSFHARTLVIHDEIWWITVGSTFHLSHPGVEIPFPCVDGWFARNGFAGNKFFAISRQVQQRDNKLLNRNFFGSGPF